MKLSLIDTTLRDGEQMPGVYFTPKQKIKLAQLSSDFGSDIIELMPSVSKKEAEVTKSIIDLGLKSEVRAFCLLRKEQIEEAVKCGVNRVVLLGSISDIHLEKKVMMSREENLKKAIEMIDLAKSYGLKVDFAGEDSTRADFEYLVDFIKAIQSKIEIFMPADTLGCLNPLNTSLFFSSLREKTKVKLEAHNHNDFGMATANTLIALKSGADYFSGTFCGIGERCGNAPIEEVIMALKFFYDEPLNVNYKMINSLCQYVEKYSKIKSAATKPITGPNAFSHKGGIHIDGVLKYPGNYENFNPKIIGRERKFCLGKYSGKKLLLHHLNKNGIWLNESKIAELLQKVKAISEQQQRQVSVDEILALARELL